MGRIAILMVDGYSPITPIATVEAIRFPWVALCLREITRRSADADYQVHVWDNSGLEEHATIVDSYEPARRWDAADHGGACSHPQALDHLIARLDDTVEFVVLLDTDAIPVVDGWLATLTGQLANGAGVVGVWRDELAPAVEPFLHVSCLGIRRDDLVSSGLRFGAMESGEGLDQGLSQWLLATGRTVVGLRRSNVINFHPVIGGLYGDLVYHHGAGSRVARFVGSENPEHDEAVRRELRAAAFGNFDQLVARLRGEPSELDF